MSEVVTIVGAGLAGCEAALQLAKRGLRVRLLEQKPQARTPAQSSDSLCELVCSNSFRGAALSNAVGLLKEEMRRLGSEVMAAAELCKVPAGGALAVDRERFSAEMTRRIEANPDVELVVGEVTAVPAERPLIVATGPLTGDALAQDLEARIGAGALAYYDAIAPIVTAESIDRSIVWAASRWGKGETEEETTAYLNCPMNREQYDAFLEAVLAAEKVEPKQFEDVRYFEGCLPIEVMAERGRDTLRYGPMKPVGLDDPRTGRWPHAVVQLRKEDAAGTAYNLVGFQSRMTWGEQKRILRMIPGLEQAEFFRFGAVHRNTFVDAPKHLDGLFQLRTEPGIYFAGQVTGTEGYVESAAGGWLVAHIVADRLESREPRLPPETSAHFGLLEQTRRSHEKLGYQPSNITFSHIAPWTESRLKKRAKYEAIAERALRDLDAWIAAGRDGAAAE